MEQFERNFDNMAAEYEESRPCYIQQIYEDMFQYRKVDTSCKVLEIGIGTGKATPPFLTTGCHLDGLEPGEHLASIAEKKYGQYPNFTLYPQTLQDYECPGETYDFIYSATAFHWIPQDYGYSRVYELLKDGGVFARFGYHAGPDTNQEALSLEMKQIYANYMNPQNEPKPYGEAEAKKLSELAEEYGFTDTQYRLYHFTKKFYAEEYRKLLMTYPDHMALKTEQRDKLFAEIENAIKRNGGVITVSYTLDLELARKNAKIKYH